MMPGSAITLQPASIKLSIGGSSISMDPASITISAPTVKISGDAMVDIKGAVVKVNC